MLQIVNEISVYFNEAEVLDAELKNVSYEIFFERVSDIIR